MVEAHSREKITKIVFKLCRSFFLIKVDENNFKIIKIVEPLSNFFGFTLTDVRLANLLDDFKDMTDVVEVCENKGPYLECERLIQYDK